MTNADRVAFGLALAEMTAAYQKEFDEAALNGYWITLRDLELSGIRAAIEVACRTSKFMPTAAAIREIVLENIHRSANAAAAAKRQAEYMAAVVYGIEQDAIRNNWTQEQLEAEVRRVGENMNLDLPAPTVRMASKE